MSVLSNNTRNLRIIMHVIGIKARSGKKSYVSLMNGYSLKSMKFYKEIFYLAAKWL